MNVYWFYYIKYIAYLVKLICTSILDTALIYCPAWPADFKVERKRPTNLKKKISKIVKNNGLIICN